MLYTVRFGDSLSLIARRAHGDARRWPEIARDNNIVDPDHIMVGQALVIRDPRGNAPPRPFAPVADHHDVSGFRGGANTPACCPAVNFVFVLADEVNPLTRKVVRRVLVNPKLGVALGRPVFPDPERFGFVPTGKDRALSPGRHALGVKPSPFSSAAKGILGARRFLGEPFYIDVAKATAAGATIHETDEIVRSLEDIARRTKTAGDAAKIRAMKGVVLADHEVLVRGAVPPTAVKGLGAMATTRVLQSVQVIGFAMSAYQIEQASEESVRTRSAKPIAAETIRQAGGWAAAWAGAKIGGAAGALVGIETGPGAIVTGAAGALIFGTAGYFGFDWVADHVHSN